MSLILNGTEIEKVNKNGTEVKYVDYNGVRVFESEFPHTPEGEVIATWEQIQTAVKNGNASQLVGLHKTIILGEINCYRYQSNTEYDSENDVDDNDNTAPSQKAIVYFVKSNDNSLTFWIGDYEYLTPAYYMCWGYSSNGGGWEKSSIRYWLNNTYIKSLPLDFKNVIKNSSVKTGREDTLDCIEITNDLLYLPAPKELKIGAEHPSSFGANTGYSSLKEYNELTPWEYIPVNRGNKLSYNVAGNQKYSHTDSNYIVKWWLRTPCPDDWATYCCVNDQGRGNMQLACYSYAVFPAGTIA